jgi:DNA polymerase elongation subunit (family B)
MRQDNYLNVFQYGNQILERGYFRNGERFMRKVKYEPTLFTDAKKTGVASEWKTLEGKPVYPVKPGSIKDCRNFIDQYKDVHGFNVYGMTNYEYQYIADTYPGIRAPDMSMIRTFFLDIETRAENGFPNMETTDQEVLLISFYDSLHKRYHVFSAKDFTIKKQHFEHDPDNIPVIEKTICADEISLFKEFMKFWANNYPDVITGWNIDTFDVPYMIRRMIKVMGEEFAKQISPWGVIREKRVVVEEDTTIYYFIAGISAIDYIEIYKKSTSIPKQENYRLDHIGDVELNRKKLNHDEFDTFRAFYEGDWDKFVAYNIIDNEIVRGIDAKHKLLDLTLTVAYDAKVNYEDVSGQIRVWDVLIYNHFRDLKIVIPNKNHTSKGGQFEGAYVKPPIVGKHRNVASFDLDSLYPHIMMWANISPETMIQDKRFNVTVDGLLEQDTDLQWLYDNNATMTANGVCYTRDKQGFLPFLMEKMYAERKKFKKEMLALEDKYEKTKDPSLLNEIARLNNLQLARKIQLNSAYGAIGSNYFRYYDLRIAEGITLSGQLAIRWMANRMNEKMNKILGTKNKDYVITIDTDAFYLTLEALVDKTMPGKDVKAQIDFMDKVCEQVIQPLIQQSYADLAKYMNSYKQAMSMKREVLADVSIFVAKKNYALSVWDSEGVRYEKPKLKVRGLALVKSSTPAVVRKQLRSAVETVLYGDEKSVQKLVANTRKEFMSLDVNDIAFPRGCNGLAKWAGSPVYRPGTPIQVRGALLFNHHAKRLKIDSKYPIIQEGDKVKYTYLRMPNAFHENVISYISKIPAEFKIDQHIDYDTMFDKAFLAPLNAVIGPLGWEAEETASLEDFFG